jgi:hypothetical protein
LNEKIELAGKKFGKWKVLKYAGKGKGHVGSRWLCQCECGTVSILVGSELRSRRTQSCKKCSRRNNIYKLMSDYGRCTTADGKSFIFDLEDYDFIKGFTWRLDCQNYVKTSIDGKTVALHRLLLQPALGKEIDHINLDPTDNRRRNLRLATRQENERNKSLSKANTSGYKGVHWHKHRNKWRAMIKVNQKSIHLGLFEEVDEAAEVYNAAAKKYFGEYAWLNPIKRNYKNTTMNIYTESIGFPILEEPFFFLIGGAVNEHRNLKNVLCQRRLEEMPKRIF